MNTIGLFLFAESLDKASFLDNEGEKFYYKNMNEWSFIFS